jgi:4-cresol dehydrogenase (hydroxylating)
MSVWLMPAPSHFEAFFFQSQESIGPLMAALRPLRMNGTLRSVVHLGNDYKVLSSSGKYPESIGAPRLVTAETMKRLRSELQVARWSGSGGLYGTRMQIGEARRALKAALRGRVDRLRFVNDRTLRMMRRLERPYRLLSGRTDLQHALTIVSPLLDVLRGIPTDGFLASAYWRKPNVPTAGFDPDRDSCGLLWCSPIAPNTAEDVEAVAQLAGLILPAHGFEPIISMSMINERSIIATIALTYDRQVADEDEKAMRCFRELMEALLNGGYPPYRLNVAAMEYADTGGDYARLLQSIKAALDPKDILAPDHYVENES